MNNRRTHKMLVEFVLSDGESYLLSDVRYVDGQVHGKYLARKRRNGKSIITGAVPVTFDRSDFVRARLFRDVDGSYPFGRLRYQRARKAAA